MKHVFAAAWISTVLFTIGCASKPADRGDAAFQKLAGDYTAGYLAWRPASGSALGLHEYDGKVTDYSAASIAREHLRLVDYRDRIKHFDLKSLSPSESIDARTLLAAIEGDLLEFEEAKSLTKNPMSYAGAFDLTGYAKRNYAPLSVRMGSAIKILKQVRPTLEQARMNLHADLPKPFVKNGIDQAKGAAEFFNGDLTKAFESVKDEALQSELKSSANDAATAMNEFAAWLEKEKQPSGNDDYPIGRDAYARMLREAGLINRTPEEVLDLAMATLKKEQERFNAVAKQIDPNKPALEVYKALQAEHPTEQSLIPDTKKHLEMIRRFVVGHDLLTMPTTEMVRVEETPTFDRATSQASMDSPGPFEKATEAFYYVTPPEASWDAKKKDEWLTAFNYYGTDVTSIHEALPGHWVQFMHLRASPSASNVQKIFGSYAYVEGWAHYCEQMMMEEGFPNGADDVTRAKYRLEQLDQSLLRICRLCVSIKLHCEKMSVDEATKFFMDNCYFEEAPARQEAERGTYDPGYGFYTLGKLQILKLRSDLRKQDGPNFSLKRFHDDLLNNGEAPIRLMREKMLKDPKTWDAAL